MNKESLLSFLKENKINFSLEGDFKDIKNVSTNLENAFSNDAIFYNILENSKSLENFFSRFEKSNPGLLILNRKVDGLENQTYLIIDYDNFLLLQDYFLSSLFPFDRDKLKLIGVTGTNGKTSVVNLGVSISEILGKKAFSIGTMGVLDGSSEIYQSINSTTPSYIELGKILHKFQDEYDLVFMEVSSHALKQKRLNNLKLDAMAWTSFSQDHLDYHHDMHDYFESKLLIYNKHRNGEIPLIVHYDETDLNNELNEKNIHLDQAMILEGTFDNIPNVFSRGFNKKNLEMALSLCKAVGFDISTVNLSKVKPPKGRFSIIDLSKGVAIIDYAHTPDALQNICSEVKSIYTDSKLTIIFGCGGDRDRLKRPLMGKAVCDFADRLVITSDNPRSEDPEQIIDDILPGIDKEYHRESDRKKAIIYALSSMVENEVIVIAGKGHEEYQEIAGKKEPFSDFKIVEDFKKLEIKND